MQCARKAALFVVLALGLAQPCYAVDGEGASRRVHGAAHKTKPATVEDVLRRDLDAMQDYSDFSTPQHERADANLDDHGQAGGGNFRADRSSDANDGSVDDSPRDMSPRDMAMQPTAPDDPNIGQASPTAGITPPVPPPVGEPAPGPANAPGAMLRPPAASQSTTPAAAPAAPPPAGEQPAVGATPASPVVGQPPATDPQSPPAATAGGGLGADKFTLPLKRYFDTKAAVALKGYDQSDRDALKQFYEARAGEPMWVDKAGYNAGAQNLIAELKKADDWGLAAADYKIPAIVPAGQSEIGDDDLSDAEIKLSLAAMRYARDARGDRITDPTTQLSSYLDRKPQLIERPKVLEALNAAGDKGEYLRSLQPKHPQFERLRQKLIELRTANKAIPQFEKIPDGPKLSPGKVHPQIALIRQRLQVAMPSGKPDGSAIVEGYYDDALARAVIAFKEKNDIEPADAKITQALRNALNKDTRTDERVILANMEEWRWMPDDLGSTYINVNIPEFMVRVVRNGTVVHAERVVTGRVETQTPIFSDMMRTVVFQPRWNVPESIKILELLPSLRNGGNPIDGRGLAIERNGRYVSAWDVDWWRQDIRNYHIYQPPGESNVLGVVKFLFPNKHSVYLHDTPSKSLFNEKVRTFSHGCMRVRNPVQLAEVILGEDKGWDRTKVDDLVSLGPEDNDITLDKPIPVHVTYFTAWVEDNGELKTFADVYGHEQRIKLALAGRWNEIVKNRDHLLPPEDSPMARSREDWDEDGFPRDRNGAQAYRYRSKPSFSDIMYNLFGN